MPRIQSLIWLLLLLLTTLQLSAKWETLEGCRLVSSSKNDGDSFVVKHDGETYTFRLYFVDTPETGLFYPDRVEEQAEYFRANLDEMLHIGRKSKDFARQFLSGRFTVHTQWSDALGYGKRYSAILYNQKGESLIEALVSEGFARIKGFKPGSAWPGGVDSDDYGQLLERLEREAKRDKEGAWRKGGGMASESDEKAKPAPYDRTNTESPVETLGDDLIDLNQANEIELAELPGIGPAYAKGIVENRPFFHVDDVVRVHGIGPTTLERLRPLAKVTLPSSFQNTARFYLQDPQRWSNSEVQLRVAGLTVTEAEAPDGFSLFKAETGSAEIDGGLLPLYLPESRIQNALAYFERSNESVMLSVYFFEYADEWVAVLRQN
ncbi:MAG: helix-hairpin-helix domain-containing protein [Verrucomicrobiota bacterium]